MNTNQKLAAIVTAAKTAHEVNRAYCIGLGDTSQLPWNDAAQWQRDSAIAGANAIASDPSMTPEQSHQGWLAVKVADGWVYGPVKNAAAKTHPCMVPYTDLPPEQRAKDTLFGTVVRGVLRARGVID